MEKLRLITGMILLLVLSCKPNAEKKIYMTDDKVEDFQYCFRDTCEKKSEDFIHTQAYGNTLIVNIYTAGQGFYCLFKDYSTDTCFRIGSVFNENMLYFFSYDSSDYDRTIIANNIDTRYLSSNLWNIYDLRKKEITTNRHFCENHDIKSLQNVVNKLPIFKNFSLKNSEQLYLLKSLLVLTQTKLLFSVQNYSLEDYITNINYRGVIEIADEQDFNEFKTALQDSNSLVGETLISHKWRLDNMHFLQSQLSFIEKDYLQPNIFYYFNYSEFLVFRFQININAGKIILEKEFLNKEYKWFSPQYAIPRVVLPNYAISMKVDSSKKISETAEKFIKKFEK